MKDFEIYVNYDIIYMSRSGKTWYVRLTKEIETRRIDGGSEEKNGILKCKRQVRSRSRNESSG